jgi:hypothetical protein
MLELMSSVTVDEAALSLQPRDRRLRQAEEGRAARQRAPRRDVGRWDTVEHTRDMGAFANAYADQVERDHRRLVDTLAAGLLPGALRVVT